MDIRREDPDPFTVGSIVIAGAALLLNLEQKIESRKTAESLVRNEVAKKRTTLSLRRIERSLLYLKDFWTFFDAIGDNEVIDDEVGGGYGAARRLLSESEYEEFNTRLDFVLYHIGRINKELYEIKLGDIYLDEQLRDEFLSRIQRLRRSLNLLMGNVADIAEKLGTVYTSLNMATQLVVELGAVLGVNNLTDVSIYDDRGRVSWGRDSEHNPDQDMQSNKKDMD